MPAALAAAISAASVNPAARAGASLASFSKRVLYTIQPTAPTISTIGKNTAIVSNRPTAISANPPGSDHAR
jgi:hypothetical protein